jgi:hypothetical protein
MNSRSSSLPAIVLVAVLTLLCAPSGFSPAAAASMAGRAPKKTVIPRIAKLAGVQIGYSTQEDLARRWGEGKTVIGGHSNSGRIWRVKGTTWAIRTDGFEYSKRGLVIDGLQLLEEDQQGRDAPYARLGRKNFAWLGGVTLGTSRSQVKVLLKRRSLSATDTDRGLEIRAAGFYPLMGAQFKTWTVRLQFTRDRLARLTIDAR